MSWPIGNGRPYDIATYLVYTAGVDDLSHNKYHRNENNQHHDEKLSGHCLFTRIHPKRPAHVTRSSFLRRGRVARAVLYCKSLRLTPERIAL